MTLRPRTPARHRADIALGQEIALVAGRPRRNEPNEDGPYWVWDPSRPRFSFVPADEVGS